VGDVSLPFGLIFKGDQTHSDRDRTKISHKGVSIIPIRKSFVDIKYLENKQASRPENNPTVICHVRIRHRIHKLSTSPW